VSVRSACSLTTAQSFRRIWLNNANRVGHERGPGRRGINCVRFGVPDDIDFNLFSFLVLLIAKPFFTSDVHVCFVHSILSADETQ
jgi:hypothetical protein